MKLLDPEILEQNYPVLRYFAYEHLPEHLKKVSKPFCELALEMAQSLPHDPETSVCLRKLLEAKDAAVRAKVSE